MFNHTCSTLTPGPCRACEQLTDAFLTTTTGPEDVRYLAPVTADRVRDVLMSGTRTVALDVVADLPGGTDPQRAYDVDTDAARAALRAMRRTGAVRAVLAQIRRSAPEEYGRVVLQDAHDVRTVRGIMRSWSVPSRVRADMKATARAIGKHSDALTTAMSEAAEANRPDSRRGSERWAAAERPDPRTYAGPVVHYAPPRALVPVPTTHDAPRWTTVRAHGPAAPVIYADERTVTGTGNDRTTTRTLTPLPFLSVADAHGRDALSLYGTAYRPDASTTAADRFAARQEPLGPVRRPSTRKRRRDGALAGPAVLTHR